MVCSQSLSRLDPFRMGVDEFDQITDSFHFVYLARCQRQPGDARLQYTHERARPEAVESDLRELAGGINIHACQAEDGVHHDQQSVLLLVGVAAFATATTVDNATAAAAAEGPSENPLVAGHHALIPVLVHVDAKGCQHGHEERELPPIHRCEAPPHAIL